MMTHLRVLAVKGTAQAAIIAVMARFAAGFPNRRNCCFADKNRSNSAGGAGLMVDIRTIPILRGMTLIAALIVTGEIAFAQNDATSANFIIPGCRAFLGPALQQDRCVGIVEGIIFASKGVVCPPKTSTTVQSVQIVVNYIDTRPTRQNDNFFALALDALKTTWPCKK
ncbi:MAG TPA: Rap1a/Tai family immunity protein [Pseudolabrys sp.]|nr:Rap1a/Tai family immunity protein [Pseudolabrys sp.]